MGFIFGGNTGMSYDDIQAKRKIAEQLLQQNASTPRNVGEGLSAIGRALAYRNITKKADAADATNKAAFDQQYSGLFAGGGSSGGSGASVPAYVPPDPNSPSQLGHDTMVALGKAPAVPTKDEISSYIATKAKEMGIDPSVAVAVANSEGLNANPNEAWQSGVVKNGQREPSYGPFQLYMGGGLGNSFLKQTGLDPRDPTTWKNQVDYALGHAKQNGWGAWYGARNSGIGDWQGIGGAQGGQPQSGSGMSIQALAEVAGSPYATPGQKAVAAALLQQQMDAADPAKQLQLEKERLEIDALKNPKEKPIEINGKLIDPKTFEVIKDYSTPEEGTTDQQNYRQYTEQETAAGRKPMSFGEFLVADEKAGVAGQPSIGTITPGYSAVQDPGNPSGYRMERIPGGPEDKSAADATKASNKETLTDVVVNAAARARSAAGNRALGGFGQGVVGAINPYSDSAEVQRQVDVLKSNATIESLNAMRAASPTGGALGAVSDSENKMLAAKAGALDPSSPNFARDLDDYELTLLKTVHGAEAGERIFKETRGDKPQIKPPATDAALPDGVTQEEWDAMTPEDRALWQN